jgi:hypothetical protein
VWYCLRPLGKCLVGMDGGALTCRSAELGSAFLSLMLRTTHKGLLRELSLLLFQK